LFKYNCAILPTNGSAAFGSLNNSQTFINTFEIVIVGDLIKKQKPFIYIQSNFTITDVAMINTSFENKPWWFKRICFRECYIYKEYAIGIWRIGRALDG
jgi:hypothetical protein